MEAAGTIPRVGIDVSDLADLVTGPGRFLSVYLITDPAIDNAALRSGQHWKTLRAELAEDGAPESVLEAVDAVVPEAHLNAPTLGVIASESGAVHVEPIGEPITRDRGEWGWAPSIGPILRWRQTWPPYLVVLADHRGADLVAARRQGGLASVVGDDTSLRKVQPGGWSQRRFQQRAENDWSRTATDVAEQAAKLARKVDARLVVLGGDVRSTHMIEDALPQEIAALVHHVDPGRAVDGAEDVLDNEVERLVSTAVAEDTVAVLDKFKEEKGQRDRAAAGVAATVDALNRSAVDLLLVHDDPEDDQQLWIGTEPTPVALGPDDGTIVDGGEPRPARLVDALVRAALGTGASLRVVPRHGPVDDGIGAILRWA